MLGEEHDLFYVTLARDDDPQIEAHKVIHWAWSLFFHDLNAQCWRGPKIIYVQCAKCGENVETVLEDMIQCRGEDAAVVTNTKG